MYAFVVPNGSRIRISHAETTAELSKSDVHAREIRSVLGFMGCQIMRERLD